MFRGAAGDGLIQCKGVVIPYSAAGLQVSKNDLGMILKTKRLSAFYAMKPVGQSRTHDGLRAQLMRFQADLPVDHTDTGRQ